MHYRQGIGQSLVLHYRPEVLRGKKPVRERRVARQIVVRVGGREVIAHHLANRRDAVRDHRPVNPIVRRPVAMESVIQHHDIGFTAKHDPVIKPHGVHRKQNRGHRRCHVKVFVVGRIVGGVLRLGDEGSDAGRAGVVCRTGCGRGEIIADGGVHRGHGGPQVGQEQKIRICGAAVQALNGQHIVARPQRIPPVGQVELFKLAGLGVRMGRRRRRIPDVRVRRVATGHQRPIQVSDEPVIILHPQSEGAEGRRVAQREGNSQVSRGVDVGHQDPHLGQELVGQSGRAVDGRVEKADVSDDIRSRLDSEVNEVPNLHGQRPDGLGRPGKVAGSQSDVVL